MFNKKGLGPVVATALLLVVAVVGVISFQSWYQGYSSSLYIQSETQSGDLTTGVERIVGESLYFKSNKDNLSISKVEIGGEDCQYTNSTQKGISKIDISLCLNSASSGTIQEAVVYTDQGIYSEEFIVNEDIFESSSSIFISLWNTSITGNTSSNQIRLPLREGGTYNFVVDWGDGTTDTITSWDQTETLHTYGEEGVYEVNITGTIDGFGFDGESSWDDTIDDGDKLLEISNWGPIRLAEGGGQFMGAENFIITATDAPNLTGVTDLSKMFETISGSNLEILGTINNWDTSSVTNMSRMFYFSENFNSSINSWDVSNVVDMSEIFAEAESFNQPLDNWDVSNVEDMEGMFRGGYRYIQFNQNISMWNTSNVIDMRSMFSRNMKFNTSINSWDVSNVTTMRYMFESADAFNQPLDNWDISNVEDLSSMFSNDARITSFNQDISSWNTSSVLYMRYMFVSASSFNQNLSSWDVDQVGSNCMSFDDSTPQWTLPKPNLDSGCLT